ncbi:hypothetical protein BKP54_27815 [Ensifer sp. 1H6]|nr:hypothetical protein BKP54_27815 [Ensifer sp. 1H6]
MLSSRKKCVNSRKGLQELLEIKDLIHSSRIDVETGDQLVKDTGEALKSIEGQVNAINLNMDAIATSTNEQSAGLLQVNAAVNQMDEVTQQNAAMVEETNNLGCRSNPSPRACGTVLARKYRGHSVRRAVSRGVFARGKPPVEDRRATTATRCVSIFANVELFAFSQSSRRLLRYISVNEAKRLQEQEKSYETTGKPHDWNGNGFGGNGYRIAGSRL